MQIFSLRILITEFDWRWSFVGFCYLVLFHLLPSFLLLMGRTTFPFALANGYIVWLGVGIVGISIYLSWRSVHPLFLEPPLASALYTFVLMVVYHRPASIPFPYTPLTYSIVLLVGSFALGFAAAGIISLVRTRRQTVSPLA